MLKQRDPKTVCAIVFGFPVLMTIILFLVNNKKRRLNMKKYLIPALILAMAASMTGCGRDNPSSASANSNVSSSETTEAASDETEAETTAPAEEKTEEATTEETDGTKETETGSTEPPEDDFQEPSREPQDLSGIAGYWYIDGDASAASLHISNDGKFEAYYAIGIKEASGYIIREYSKEIPGYYFVMYLDSGEKYMTFDDDGTEQKNDIYLQGENTVHYVRLYGEGGLADDGRGPGEEFCGSWMCDRAHLEITQETDTEFHAVIKWGASASAHAEWDYPLVLENGKLVCSGKGTKTFVEYKEAGSEPEKTVEYTDGSAEFEMSGSDIKWNDKKEHSGDDMLFKADIYA